MRRLLLHVMAAAGVSVMGGRMPALPVVWHDDFATARGYERRPGHAWKADGTIRVGDTVAMLLPPLPPFSHGSVAVELSVERRTGTGWTYAGVALHGAPGNTWQLLLVEGPDGTRYLEMLEELEGVRHAQSGAVHDATLAGEESGLLRTWRAGQRYRLALSLGPTGIEGSIQEIATGASWTKSYRFGGKRAVLFGRPAVLAAGIAGRLHRLEVQAAPEPVSSRIAVPQGTSGAAVILRDRPGKIAPRLAEAFSRAGFGVRVVGWDDLAAKRLQRGEGVLFVLADARELPTQGRDEVLRMLSTGGRVMAIGAPAAMALLAKSVAGWKDRDGWSQARVRTLKRTPVTVVPSAWKRSAYRAEQRATIQQDGGGAWRIETDLLGWDAWYADVPGAFGTDRSLLVFEARGDAATTHMAVECVELDGSRWIATVPLTQQWRWYALSPSDFPYWTDSPTRNRGGPGDRFHPENVARISFGLSGSHTPRVKPGRHVFWLRNLSTASGGAAQPDFSLPDIEGLWPSYKLYPMDDVASLRASEEQGIVRWKGSVPWKQPALSPVWRERGRGFRRNRAWRWVPVLEAYDRSRRKRGALLSLMVGDNAHPNAVWANVSVANPSHVLEPPLLSAVIATARAMVRGTWLLEGGAEFFSYKPGEVILLGARALHAGPRRRPLTVRVRVADGTGKVVFSSTRRLHFASSEIAEASWQWRPLSFDNRGYTVTTVLEADGQQVDTIVHRIDALRTRPPQPHEFVRVQGNMFTLGGKPWFFQGINYWPTWMAGYPNLNQRGRECYDPEIIERDLAWMQSAGINVVSAIAGMVPPDPDDPSAYRDQLDFVERCLRHGIRCYFTLPYARPYAGADFVRVKQYIEKAGLHNHPGIMAWELAWEPIEGAWGKDLEKFGPDWNRWIIEQYGSATAAVQEWGYDPRSDPSQPIPPPTHQQCTQAGPWNRYVTAFSRAFSDLISRAYGRIVRPLRAWDPNHLISFRGGACGIPSGGVFAHIHSVGVARHLDFLCPEGYSLQTGGWATPTPPDEIRKGGLVTAYYRAVSRDKPVVWMEFGFTVNGFGEPWRQERYRVRASELEHQRTEIERFYQMMIESGARGAAPWWLPGGFRCDEKSDFGFVEPDGSERPVCSVMKHYLPLFARVGSPREVAYITVDVDRERHHAWDTYSGEYLRLVKEGRSVAVRFPDMGSDAASSPLYTLDGEPLAPGAGPPRALNAEFDTLELKVGEGPWVAVEGEAVLDVPRGAAVYCRAVIGNTGNMSWRAESDVSLVALGVAASAARPGTNVPPMATVRIGPYCVQDNVQTEATLTFRMALGQTLFGEARRVSIRVQ